ncbi:MAG: acyltransferase family protein [Novosphingobium sp.]
MGANQPDAEPAAPVPRRIVELDGLRTVAILLVILYHVLRVPVAHHSPLDYPTRPFAFGWGGVDVFFVLSGFLIGGILFAQRDRPGAMKRFLVRRCVRIVPLYFVVLAVFFLARGLNGPPWMLDGAAPVWTYLTLTQNFATAFLKTDAWALGPTWSLAVEVQLYLLLGLLILFAPRRWIKPVLWAGIAVSVLLRLALVARGEGIMGYFLTPARMDGAFIGALVSQAILQPDLQDFARRNGGTLWMACAALIGLAMLSAAAGQGIGSPGAGIFGHFGLSLATAIVILLIVSRPGDWPNALLRSHVMTFIGAISYGIYLLHLPVIGTVHALFGRDTVLLNGTTAAVATVTGIAATVAIAYLSFRWFETPLNKRAHRYTSA